MWLMHVGTPTVALFGSTSEIITGPYRDGESDSQARGMFSLLSAHLPDRFSLHEADRGDDEVVRSDQ